MKPCSATGRAPRPCAVAEQDARRAVGEVHHLREHVRSDHEGTAVQARRQHPGRLRDPVHEPRAGCQVVRRRVDSAEPVGEDRLPWTEEHVRRDRGDDQQVDVGPFTSARSSASLCRRQRDVRERLVVGGVTPLANPVRGPIHSSDVSTSLARSSFVTTRAGTWQPSPVIETGVPLATAIIRRQSRRSASRAPRARRRPARSLSRGPPARARPRSRR